MSTRWSASSPPFAGDRKFGDDAAIVGGFGRFRGESVCIIGHEKGSSTESRLKHNFGMARPEGYRKAVRLMDMADRFDIPVLALVDTAGAYPGIDAEERGQAEAIARSTEACLSLGVPNVAVILGEGGSGGAIAIATANRVLMLEHAIYSVISPEGAASILWRDTAKAQDAATSMKITASDLAAFGIIDAIVPRAGRRCAPRSGRRHRHNRRCDRDRAGRAQGPRPRDPPPPASRQVPRHRPWRAMSTRNGWVWPGCPVRQDDSGNSGNCAAFSHASVTILPFVHRSHAQSRLGLSLGFLGFRAGPLRRAPPRDNDPAMTPRGLPSGSGSIAFEPQPARSRLDGLGGLARRHRAGRLQYVVRRPLPMTRALPGRLSEKMVDEIEAKNMPIRIADPGPCLQGRIRARSLEAGSHRPLRVAQDLSDLPLVGRTRAQDQGRRPPGARGLLQHHARRR